MPKYSYHCENCKEYFDTQHSINEKLEDCILCESKKTLERVPVIPIFISQNPSQTSGESKPGAVVEEYIEKNREDLKKEKKRLKEIEYK